MSVATHKSFQWKMRGTSAPIVVLLPLAFLSLVLPPGLWAQSESRAYLNPALPPELRAADLVARMTLQEKVLQMQNNAPSIARLGVPSYEWWNEALHGVARAGRATVFPQAIGLAATWDTTLMQRIADAISTEARAKFNQAQHEGDHGRNHGLTFWSPNINIFRDPRWGRGQETYGEDPFLTSRMAVAFIRGMQGDDAHYLKTVATPKHFAVHSGPETSRHAFDARPSATDLNQTYLPAFQAAISEAHADSLMCAYNRVNGVPACASRFLLGQTLREQWGFQGYVVTDCGAVTDMVEGHKVMHSLAEAAAAAVKAGADLTCGDEYGSLIEAVHRNLITEDEINGSVVRLFTARFRLGLFDRPEQVPFTRISPRENDSAAHRQLALEAARESMVLLKNPPYRHEAHLLPLVKPHRIAVIGPGADDPDMLEANYHGTASRIVTPLGGMLQQFGGESEIRYAPGSTFTSVSAALLPFSVLEPPRRGPGSWPRGTHGQLAEYFANPDFLGEPVLTRIEKRVDLERQREDQALESHLPRNRFSVRWSGTLRAPYSGDYKLEISRVHCDDCPGDDLLRLFLDGKLVLTDPASDHPASGQFHFDKGQRLDLRVEYSERQGGVGAQLRWIPPASAMLDEAVDAVRQSDVAVAFVGLNSELEGEELSLEIPGFSGGDRTSLDLPEPQQRMLEAVQQTQKPLVVVLMSGSAIAANFAQEHADALLEAWYGGEEAGTAIAQTLAGENNPSGRLPVTFYRSASDLPSFDDYSMRGRTYRYYSGPLLYPFGFGLSYSAFRYSGLCLRSKGRDHAAVKSVVRNVSTREGDEIAQLYVGRESRDPSGPIRELRGFQKIHLRAGERKSIEFDVDLKTVHQGVSEGGLHISVGGGQPSREAAFVDGLYVPGTQTGCSQKE
jgi:beta-glucosidase